LSTADARRACANCSASGLGLNEIVLGGGCGGGGW
jgi:hypothetical protein